MRLKFYAFALLFSAAFLSVGVHIVFSQGQNNSQVEEQIRQYEQKISELRGQQQTLSSQIGIMDNQIKLTEARIAATQEKIKSLGKDIDIAKNKVSDLEDNIGKSTKALLGRIAGVYQIGSINPWEMLLTSDSISNFMTRLTYLKVVQAYDKRNIYTAEQAKNDYNNQKQIFEDKQKEQEALSKKLEDYNAQLEGEKKNKQRLLAETQGSESNYQRLLAQARAQLSAFSNYAQTFGTTLVPHQDLSDGWGKYFNQRDSQWGNLLVNNDSSNCRGGPCTLARIGCLVTSYTMVSSHFGSSIIPSDAAVNSGNFYLGSADFNRPGPSANGHGVSYVADPSIQQLKDALSSGAAVIAGLSMNGGPSSTHYSDHWVVLRSVDGESFRINDPAYQGAMNVSLNDHYASWTIIEARIYR